MYPYLLYVQYIYSYYIVHQKVDRQGRERTRKTTIILYYNRRSAQQLSLGTETRKKECTYYLDPGESTFSSKGINKQNA